MSITIETSVVNIQVNYYRYFRSIIHYYRTFNSDMLVVGSGTKLHLLFWTASNAYNEHVFKQAMEAIKKESVVAYEWLLGEPAELWARYTFPVSVKCPDNTIYFVESFNGEIELLWYKPIFILLKAVSYTHLTLPTNREV